MQDHDVFEAHERSEDLTMVEKNEGASCILGHTSSFKHLRRAWGDPGQAELPRQNPKSPNDGGTESGNAPGIGNEDGTGSRSRADHLRLLEVDLDILSVGNRLVDSIAGRRKARGITTDRTEMDAKVEEIARRHGQ